MKKIVFIITFLLMINLVSAATVLYEDFEDGVADGFSAYSGDVDVDATSKLNGTYSLELTKDAATYDRIYKTITEITSGTVILKHKVKFTTKDQYQTAVFVGDSDIFGTSTNRIVTCMLYQTTKIKCQDGSLTWHDTGIDPTLNQEYIIQTEIDLDADTYDVYIDGVLKINGISAQNSGLNIEEIGWADSNAASKFFYVDDILLCDNGACSAATPSSDYFQINAKAYTNNASINTFTATLFNSTNTYSQATTNGSVFFNISTGDYSLNVSALNYATFNTSLTNVSNNDTYTAYLYENNTISITIYDGKSYQLIDFEEISYQITGNDTSYYLEGSTTNGTLQLSSLDADNYAFEFFKTDLYPTQEYFVTLQDNEYKELDVYLINNTYIATTIVTLVDPYDVKLEGATITIQESIGGSFVTVSQRTTDSTGRARFYLKDDETYKAIIENTGYQTRTATITPVTNPYEVTLRIDPELSYDYVVPTSGVSYRIETHSDNAGTDTFLLSENHWFNMTVSSPSGLLSWFAVKHLSNISNVTTSPSGGTTGIELNLSNVTGQIVVEYSFKVSGSDLFARNVTYYLTNLTYDNSSIYISLPALTSEISWLWKIIIMIVSAILLMFVAFELGAPAETYGFILTGVSVFYALPNIAWLPPIMPITISILTIFGTYVSITRRGGY